MPFPFVILLSLLWLAMMCPEPTTEARNAR